MPAGHLDSQATPPIVARDAAPAEAVTALPQGVRVMLVDDASQHGEDLLNALRRDGLGPRPLFVHDRVEFIDALALGPWDLLLLRPAVDDMALPEMCRLVRAAGLDAVLLLLTERDPTRLLVQAMAQGVADVVSRRHVEHLRLVVARELGHLQARRGMRSWRERAAQAEGRCLSLLDAARDALAYVHDGMHVHANPAYLALFGYAGRTDELAGLPLLDLFGTGDGSSLREAMRATARDGRSRRLEEVVARRADGGELTVSVAFASAGFDGEPCLQVSATDLTERRRLQQQVRHLRARDPSTGLYNLLHLRGQLQAAARAAEAGQPGALLLVEIENFDEIRHTVGMTGSDALVREVAGIIAVNLFGRDVLARVAERTFGVLLRACESSRAAAAAERVRAAVDAHIGNVAGACVTLRCSVGVALVEREHGGAERVLQEAERALRAALQGGGEQVRMARDLPSPMPLALATPAPAPDLDLDRLSAALRDGRGCLMYQPIVSLGAAEAALQEVQLAIADATGRLSCVPGAARALLDDTAQSAELDAWVLARAMETMAVWRGRGGTGEQRLLLHLSPASLRDGDRLLALLRTTRLGGAGARCVVFAMHIGQALAQLRSARAAAISMQQAGVGVALSGFGIDAADFAVLKHISADYLLLAPQLVSDLASDQARRQHLVDVQQRTRALGHATIATGIGDAPTLAALWDCGVSLAQGDYIQEASTEPAFDQDLIG